VRTIIIIALKEIQEGLRNRWVLATTLLLAALALSLTFLGSAPTGNVGASRLDVVVVSLSSLTIFLLPLIALLISHDAVVGEMERGTMILLLSYPVGRYQVILGKFCGHVLILAFATMALSWLFVHVIFALHYAHEYYAPDPTEDEDYEDGLRGGLRFPGGQDPDYWDFLHFSAIIGVASQTADIEFTSRTQRRIGTVHCLVSFVFNTVVLALTINLLAGLF